MDDVRIKVFFYPASPALCHPSIPSLLHTFFQGPYSAGTAAGQASGLAKVKKATDRQTKQDDKHVLFLKSTRRPALAHCSVRIALPQTQRLIASTFVPQFKFQILSLLHLAVIFLVVPSPVRSSRYIRLQTEKRGFCQKSYGCTRRLWRWHAEHLFGWHKLALVVFGRVSNLSYCGWLCVCVCVCDVPVIF